MTRGEGGWLFLPSAGLSPAILRQLACRTSPPSPHHCGDVGVAFDRCDSLGAPDVHAFDAQYPCPSAPLSTLHLPPHSDRRMTRGESGWLLLLSAGLPPAVLRQLAWRTTAACSSAPSTSPSSAGRIRRSRTASSAGAASTPSNSRGTAPGSASAGIAARRIYRTLGAEHVRHRRPAAPDVVRRRLLSLDYVLDHPHAPWLPTEDEKVSALTALGIAKQLVP